MPVISVASLKGGVGKTTIAIHLAHGLARAGYQTLLIDCDPSCHASRFLGVDYATENVTGVSELIRPSEQIEIIRDDQQVSLQGIPSETLRIDVRRNLDLVPGTAGFRVDQSVLLRSLLGSAGEYYLKDTISALSDCYSFIVIDTGPELSLLTRNALRCSSTILIPTDGSLMSVDSFSDLIEYDKESPSQANRCVVRNMSSLAASRTSMLAEAAIKERISQIARQYGQRTGYHFQNRIGLLESVIKRAEAINQLSFKKCTAYDSRSGNLIKENFDQLVQEILYLSIIRSEESSEEFDQSQQLSPG